MYEAKTMEALLAEKLARVPDTLDKREGSVIYDALAPNSLEAARLYAALDTILQETFADTASRDMLIRRCAERGISPYPATYAEGAAEFNCDITIGARFSLGAYNWAAAEKTQDHKYRMTCETAGAAPNGATGHLLPIDYIEGLTAAELTSVTIPGENEESTESLRTRYFASFGTQAFGGNRTQYLQWVKALPGVGGCKLYRAWNGGGTAKVVITNADGGVPTAELIAAVQTALDPGSTGEGLGTAPIDHVVAVAGATGKTIAISASLTLAEGWALADALPGINAAIDAYFEELNATWDTVSALIVRASYIETRLLALDAVLDISGVALNNISGNITLAADEIAVRGEFTNAS